MGLSNGQASPGVEALLKGAKKGRPFPEQVRRALLKLTDQEISQEGLARLFQPTFPGVRTFCVQTRVASDQAVETTLIGIARDGTPVWTGTRAFAIGRDGSLELHRGFDQIDQACQHRNITVDLMQRELEILAHSRSGPKSRLTIDGDEVGRYVCSLHGFVFADETEEGPPIRSIRALEPDGDREALVAAAINYLEQTGERLQMGRIAIEGAIEQAKTARSGWDFARLAFPGIENPLVSGSDAEMGVTQLGKNFLLNKDTPGWRAALYVLPPDRSVRELGDAYRILKTRSSIQRIDEELTEAQELLKSPNRASRIKGIQTIGMLAPLSWSGEVKPFAENADRRVAGVARKVLRQISGGSLLENMQAYFQNEKNPIEKRAQILRVLAEHYPEGIKVHSTLLRVHPDARIQRAIIPEIARSYHVGPELAAMFAANPSESEEERPGLKALRAELIERLGALADPSTLPSLMAAYRTQALPPEEQVALSRALVAFADPRAQMVLAEAARDVPRPQLP